MGLVSVWFLIFMAAVTLVYYLVPQKGQWIVLLLASLFFYGLCAKGFLVCLLLFAVIVYLFAKRFETDKKPLLVLLEIILLIALVIVLKYAGWFGSGLEGALGWLGSFRAAQYIVPLGISYIMLMGLGYSLDVYRGTIHAEGNFLKVLGFLAFFPALTQGPINRFAELVPQMEQGNRFRYEMLVLGVQRMLWGFFKKLVIAGRLGLVMTELTGGWKGSAYSGIYVFLAVIVCSFYLFMDFSGCMDIVIGAAEILGIKLPENFDHPYLAENMPQFWRKWHITLGAWLRDYVLYSFTMSGAAKKMNRSLREKIGRRGASSVISIIGVLFVWLVFGLWHGIAANFLIAAAYYALTIIVGILIEAPVKKFHARFPRLNGSVGFQIFRVVRTFVLSIQGAYLMLIPNVKSGFAYLLSFFTHPTAQLVVKTEGELAGGIRILGLDPYDFVVLILSFAFWIVVSLLHRKKDVRLRLAGMHIVPRWVILLAVVIATVLFGLYGGGDLASFIYQGF